MKVRAYTGPSPGPEDPHTLRFSEQLRQRGAYCTWVFWCDRYRTTYPAQEFSGGPFARVDYRFTRCHVLEQLDRNHCGIDSRAAPDMGDQNVASPVKLEQLLPIQVSAERNIVSAKPPGFLLEHGKLGTIAGEYEVYVGQQTSSFHKDPETLIVADHARISHHGSLVFHLASRTLHDDFQQIGGYPVGYRDHLAGL